MSSSSNRRSTTGLFSPATPRRSIHKQGDATTAPDTPPRSPADSAPAGSASSSPRRAATAKEHREFGGAFGALALIVWSHYILYYFWYCLETARGHLVLPRSVDEAKGHWDAFLTLFNAKAIPTDDVWRAYGAFFLSQIVLAAILPGVTVTGLGSSQGGQRLKSVVGGRGFRVLFTDSLTTQTPTHSHSHSRAQLLPC
jgi:hypothetical protein